MMNANLMIELREAPPTEGLRSTLGGVPAILGAAAWPTCGRCFEPLTCLAQLKLRDADPILPDRLLLLFCCQRSCEVGGGPRLPSHHARCVEAHGPSPSLPPGTALQHVSIGLVPFDQDALDYDTARFQLNGGAFVYGMIGGVADSVSRHVPRCDACQTSMRFIASLEEGALFNFAGVQLFAFTCLTCFNSELFVDDFF
jgi:hypothetical protein